jgi:hypothetical protein
MRFETVGVDKMKADLNRLEEVMKSHGMLNDAQWDYERITFDKKFEIKEGTYYLRIPGLAVSGDIGRHDAVIQLMTPLLGKHYYPHGVEYGEGEHFPAHLVTTCEKLLAEIKAEVSGFAE